MDDKNDFINCGDTYRGRSRTTRTCRDGRIHCCLISRKTCSPVQKIAVNGIRVVVCAYLNSRCTYNQKACAQHYTLHFNVQIHWEIDSKEVGIGEHLTRYPGPLLGDLAHLRTIDGRYLEPSIKSFFFYV